MGKGKATMHKRNEPGQDVVADAIAVAIRAGRGLLVGLFLVSLAALVYYLFRGYIPEFNTDSAFKSLLAGEVVRQGSYFPSDWNYVNGDLWVLFGQIFIIPFLPFFKNSYTLHAVSGLISSAIVLISLWCASGMVMRSAWMRLLTVTIFAGGVSWVMAENLFGQVSYGNVLYVAVFTLYFSWRWLEATSRRASVIWAVALVVLGILAFWGNPQRAAAYDIAPMLAALLAWAMARGDLFTWHPGARRWKLTGDARRLIILGVMLFGAALVGTILHVVSLAQAHSADGAGSARWLSLASFKDNLWFTLEGILGVFGALPTAGRSVMSPWGAYEALRLLSVLAMLVLLPSVCCGFLRDARPGARMLAAFTASGLCLFIFLQVTTTTPDMTGPVMSARYMLPSLVLGLVLVLGHAESQGLRTPTGVASWCIALVLASSLVYPGNSFSRLYRGTPPSHHVQAMDVLKAHGLQYGYGTYWNSGVITILSGGDVRVRQIEFDRGLPIPRLHLASRSWFRPQTWTGKSFLLLSKEEAAQLDRDTAFTFTGAPLEEFPAGDFVVLVFKENLASTLPNWDVDSSSERAISDPLGTRSQHQIGRLDKIEGRLQLAADAGETGFLHYGPYVTLPAGDYRVDVDVSAPSTGEVGYIDVVGNMGATVLAKTPIAGPTAAPVSLRLTAAEAVQGVEVRVFSNGASAMTLRSITLQPVTAAKALD
jgi:hypothetical protein